EVAGGRVAHVDQCAGEAAGLAGTEVHLALEAEVFHRDVLWLAMREGLRERGRRSAGRLGRLSVLGARALGDALFVEPLRLRGGDLGLDARGTGGVPRAGVGVRPEAAALGGVAGAHGLTRWSAAVAAWLARSALSVRRFISAASTPRAAST